eukprot:TRINITY_DN40147_c0_g1_i1.p1 TRINITY_DN40147_c0_g1~~TRINITY_DN40147_c0_g1_i1.p1  ORF type:complete len:152 (+),score=30.19 TRINITY_DN40147_c0_g1_i1:80-535(+)
MTLASLAKGVLGLGATYVGSLMVIKVLSCGSIYLLPQSSRSLVNACVWASALATALDIVVRILASSSSAFSFSRHGADALLAALLVAYAFLCHESSGERSCKALRMVIPFVVLVSVGGNMMRLNRAPKEDKEAGIQELELGAVVGSDHAVE